MWPEVIIFKQWITDLAPLSITNKILAQGTQRTEYEMKLLEVYNYHLSSLQAHHGEFYKWLFVNCEPNIKAQRETNLYL